MSFSVTPECRRADPDRRRDVHHAQALVDLATRYASPGRTACRNSWTSAASWRSARVTRTFTDAPAWSWTVQRRQTVRSAGRASQQIRNDRQSQDGEGAGSGDFADSARSRRRGDRVSATFVCGAFGRQWPKCEVTTDPNMSPVLGRRTYDGHHELDLNDPGCVKTASMIRFSCDLAGGLDGAFCRWR